MTEKEKNILNACKKLCQESPKFAKELLEFLTFDESIRVGVENATDATLKVTINNPIFIYNQELNFLNVCDSSHVDNFLAQGFKTITQEEAMAMPQYATISKLL